MNDSKPSPLEPHRRGEDPLLPISRTIPLWSLLTTIAVLISTAAVSYSKLETVIVELKSLSGSVNVGNAKNDVKNVEQDIYIIDLKRRVEVLEKTKP